MTRRFTIDISPLRESRDFRLVWTSGFITSLGAMVTYVAAPFQIKELTGSYLLVGLIGLAELVPLVVFGLYGGVLADQLDRRKMVIRTEFGFLLCLGALIINAELAKPRTWVIFLVAAAMSALDGLQRPSLDAMMPRLVPRHQLAAMGALRGFMRNATFLVGTSLGGVLAASFGVQTAYALDAITYLLSIFFLLRIQPVPVESSTSHPSWQQIREGAEYAWSRKDLLGTYVVDLSAMIFAFPNSLFPFLADHFKNPSALGFLYAAGAIGALLATLTSGWTTHIRRPGMAVAIAAMTWGAAIWAAGLVNTLPLVLLCLAAAGAADMVSGIFRSLIWNSTIPDEIRGRLASIELLSYAVGPQVGQLRAGLAAQSWGLSRALTSGGLICIGAVAFFTGTNRQLRTCNINQGR